MLAELRSSDNSQFTQFTMKSLQDSQNNDQTVSSTQENCMRQLDQGGDNEDSRFPLSCDKGSCLFLDGQYDFDCSVDSDSFPVKKPGLKKQDLKDKLLQKQTKQLEHSVIDQTSAIPLLDISNEKSNDNENNSILNDSLMVIEVDGNSSKTESEKKNRRIVIPETPCGFESKISHNSSCNKGKSTIKYFQAILNEMRSYITSQNSEIITITYKGGTMEKSAPMQYFSHQYPFLFTAINENTLNLSKYSRESVEFFWKVIMGECDSLYSAFSFGSEFIEIFKRYSLERLIIEKDGETLTDPSDDDNRSKALFDDCSWSNNTWEALAEASDDRRVNESVGINSLQSEIEKGEEIYLNSPENYEEDREFLTHSIEFDMKNTTPKSSNSNHLNTPVSWKNSNKTNSPIVPSPFTPMPNYDEMNTPTLKGECKRFGVKGLPKRKMKTILKTIYHGTHQYENDSTAGEELPSINDVTSPNVKKFKKSKASKDSQKKEGTRNLNEKNKEIIKEIRKNTELYTSILHYEVCLYGVFIMYTLFVIREIAAFHKGFL
ncbi:DgyrCDS3486 [Dimorphilus gyrociliatus]|uniref:DgyrCDS3486 n=1 Tax=Dimorphilus gyrociliatus TaxID=2664684 RepID=A0A7I8VFA3_9ANNE|nr:DgyrCDS3486 [Dimorphilus gyrociliatus]